MLSIASNDPKFSNSNKLSRSQPVGTPGVQFVKGGVLIVPSQYFPDEQQAIAALKTEDVIKLLNSGVFAVACDSQDFNSEIPSIGQRTPTIKRKKSIIEGWGNTDRTPENKVETIDVSVFGCEVTKRGIFLNEGSLITPTDGAGRLSALVHQQKEVSENQGCGDFSIIPLDRGFLWLIIFDLSGDRRRAHQNFLLHNRDAKRTNQGTNQCVEIALFDESVKSGHTPLLLSYNDTMTTTYICRTMYKKEIIGSILELFPWSYEGCKSTSNKFCGRGKASNLQTALRDLKDMLTDSGIKPNELPPKLDFAFRIWHMKCPVALEDARRAARKERQRYSSKYRLHTTLALKVMIMISVRAMAVSGLDPDLFITTCENILKEHCDIYRESYIGKNKNITMDKFWQECKWFGDDRFNSGATNAGAMAAQFKKACDIVCGTQNLPKKSKKIAVKGWKKSI
jgi:hypothetical protein